MLEVRQLEVILLIGAGLLIRTLVEMQRAPLGFEPAGLYRATILLPDDRYSTNDARGAAFAEIRTRAAALPGVAQADWSTGVPPELGVSVGTLQIEGRETKNTGREFIGFNMTAPDYFKLTGTPLLDGRLFTTGPEAEREILINQRFAQEQ
ncbi:MAG: hypothetical protein KDI36_19025, partial [Pseudomonadales bacterium]|nr:hypothetical protein [Pseudomonadales bacterium]